MQQTLSCRRSSHTCSFCSKKIYVRNFRSSLFFFSEIFSHENLSLEIFLSRIFPNCSMWLVTFNKCPVRMSGLPSHSGLYSIMLFPRVVVMSCSPSVTVWYNYCIMNVFSCPLNLSYMYIYKVLLGSCTCTFSYMCTLLNTYTHLHRAMWCVPQISVFCSFSHFLRKT